VSAAQRQAVKNGDLSLEERVAEKKERRGAHEALATQIRDLPNKKYGLIVADPEWEFKVWNKDARQRPRRHDAGLRLAALDPELIGLATKIRLMAERRAGERDWRRPRRDGPPSNWAVCLT
jgi:hypothetical protein